MLSNQTFCKTMRKPPNGLNSRRRHPIQRVTV
jgi:hypothetical protein